MTYLDNAATMTKFKEAIREEAEFYTDINANPLRGLYKKSVQAETGVEECRKRILELVRADEDYIVVFTRGTTEALNLIAEGLADKNVRVAVDIESHHSNILPWKERYKDVLIVKSLEELEGAEIISLTGVSNVTGEDFSERIRRARMAFPEAILGVDAAQMMSYGSLDVKRLGVDFAAFSGHKFGAPMGIGGLIIRKELAERLRPLLYGGEMVDTVNAEGVPSFSEVPARLEAGTLPVGAIFGLSAAVKKWLEDGFQHEKVVKLAERAAAGLGEITGVEVLAANGAIVTFKIDGVHAHDVAQILAGDEVCVRAGWLCAEPYLRYKGWGPVVRASFSIFNTEEDVSQLLLSVSKVREKMGLKNV